MKKIVLVAILVSIGFFVQAQNKIVAPARQIKTVDTIHLVFNKNEAFQILKSLQNAGTLAANNTTLTAEESKETQGTLLFLIQAICKRWPDLIYLQATKK